METSQILILGRWKAECSSKAVRGWGRPPPSPREEQRTHLDSIMPGPFLAPSPAQGLLPARPRLRGLLRLTHSESQRISLLQTQELRKLKLKGTKQNSKATAEASKVRMSRFRQGLRVPTPRLHALPAADTRSIPPSSRLESPLSPRGPPSDREQGPGTCMRRSVPCSKTQPQWKHTPSQAR